MFQFIMASWHEGPTFKIFQSCIIVSRDNLIVISHMKLFYLQLHLQRNKKKIKGKILQMGLQSHSNWNPTWKFMSKMSLLWIPSLSLRSSEEQSFPGVWLDFTLSMPCGQWNTNFKLSSNNSLEYIYTKQCIVHLKFCHITNTALVRFIPKRILCTKSNFELREDKTNHPESAKTFVYKSLYFQNKKKNQNPKL